MGERTDFENSILACKPTKTPRPEMDNHEMQRRKEEIEEIKEDNLFIFGRLRPYCSSHKCKGGPGTVENMTSGGMEPDEIVVSKKPCEINCDGNWIEVYVKEDKFTIGKKTYVQLSKFGDHISMIEFTDETKDIIKGVTYITAQNTSSSSGTLEYDPSPGDMASFILGHCLEMEEQDKETDYCKYECPIVNCKSKDEGPGNLKLDTRYVKEDYRTLYFF